MSNVPKCCRCGGDYGVHNLMGPCRVFSMQRRQGCKNFCLSLDVFSFWPGMSWRACKAEQNRESHRRSAGGVQTSSLLRMGRIGRSNLDVKVVYTGMSIYQLSDDEVPVAFRDCVKWIENKLAEPDETYASLARNICVGESALKQFVRRGGIERTSIRRGASFDKIYQYITSYRKYNKFGEIIKNRNSDLTDEQKAQFYFPLMEMLKIEKESMLNIEEKILRRKKYYCIRRAISEEYYVLSEIKFEEIINNYDFPVWEFTHHYIDGSGEDKKSDGIVFTQHKNIYLFGDISKGEGIETLVLRESAANFLFGFMISSDDYKPFFANMIFIESEFANEKLKSPFLSNNKNRSNLSWDKILGVVPKKFIESLSLGEESDFGSKKIAPHLEVGSTQKPVIRIKDPFIVPKF